jgi:outer membrane lipoprotein-sorting protein
MKYLLPLLVLLPLFGFAQTSAKLNKVITKLNTVKDYSVDVDVKADIPMIKILPSKAKVYFKQKDKFKVVSKGIVILPKQGFTEINSFLTDKDKYMAIEGDTSKIAGVKVQLITVIPKSEDNEIILAKIWIDDARSLIMKTQVTTKTNGTVTTTYSYGDMAKYALPNKMVFEIDVKKFKLPKSMAADINQRSSEKKEDNRKKGTITVNLINYKVNSGLSDDIFKK